MANLPTHFDFSGTAFLSVKNCRKGPTYFKFTADKGQVPLCGDVVAEQRLLDAAWRAGSANLTMLDMTFDVKVLGTSNKTGALLIESAPLFGALFARANSPY